MAIPVTLQRHLTDQQKLHPAASGQFSSLLWEFVLAVKMIAREVRRAGLIDILGAAGHENVHGEKVQKLDDYAQERLEVGMARTGLLCAMASEERSEIIPIPREYSKGKYVFLFDPLDGSSNIDVNISIGTIFSIHRRLSKGDDGTLEDCLQPGTRQIAAGYVLYGSSVMMVFTTGKGVHGFTLDPTVGEFLLSHPDIRIPVHGKTYSINEGNSASWDPGTEKYVAYLKEKDDDTRRPYSARYVGTLVADFHRTLINGGIFLYPASPKPKLRLLYEASPLAMIAEQAGGKAITGRDRILDIVPDELHKKVPFVVGSPEDVDQYQDFFLGGDGPAKSKGVK
ncbi:MAG TPA: class 1 fructose-bisphosphatase [Planctomycetota bacterium]|nr:class 1 fructose-bisphosphatase [Planctomycetota bacterium]